MNRVFGGISIRQMLRVTPSTQCRCLLHNLSSETFSDHASDGGPKGAPITIMHGLFGSKQNWRSISKQMNKTTVPTRDVITLDARNHGQSPRTSTHTYDDLADDIKDFLQAQNIDKTVVIGHSMGGRAMMVFALKYPKMVEKAIIVDISPVRSSPLLESMETLFGAMLSVNIPQDLDLKAARKSADSQLQTIITNPGTREFIMLNFIQHPDGKYGWKVNVETLHREFRNHISRFPTQWLSKSSSVPTLFIGGNQSDFISADQMPAIQKIFPNSRLEMLNCDHLVHIEKPHEMLKLVLDFVNQ